MYRPRFLSIATTLALVAGFGAAAVPSYPAVAPAAQISVRRDTRTQRRSAHRSTTVLPGKKGLAQKRSGKTCQHRKTARQRRRAANLRRG
jgi:hypothetical protein